MSYEKKISIESRYKDTQILQSPVTPSLVYWRSWNCPLEFLYFAGNTTKHVVRSFEVGRLDIVSNQYFGTPRMWWCIAALNGITNPIVDMAAGDEIIIPDPRVVALYTGR